MTGQRFPCTGQMLVGINSGSSTTIFGPLYLPFGTPFLSPLARYPNASFDALGFNSKDNFIYGAEENTNNIVRLKRDNTFERIGSVSMHDTLKSNAGDCTPEGLYLCHDYELNQILVFDVVDGFQLLNEINLFWDPSSENSGPFKTRIFDFAIDPNYQSYAYAYQGTSADESLMPQETRGYLLQINIDFDDPNLGMVTPLTAIDPIAISHLGALMFSSRSDLQAYGTFVDGFNPGQDRLYSINRFSGQASQILRNPEGVLSDGCSCPFSFNFINDVPTEGMFCNNDVKNFILTIDNQAYNSIDGIILRDTLPEGMIIEEVSDNFEGDIVAGTGVGFNILEITKLVIPPKTTLEIIIRVQSVDAKVGDTYNQAFLENLPARFGGDIASDNRGTVGRDQDPSYFYVVPRKLEEVTWEITQPTDCIATNDGKIVVTSPQFFPGQEFEVKLRNKIGWDELWSTVIIDGNNSFSIDSLLPGDYQVFQVRSTSDNCGLAVKDTTILLEAPHDLLDLTAGSNSPICEGESLVLSSDLSPEGNIHWSGPRSFGSESFDPIIENTELDRAGEYRITGEYGYCEQIKYIEVDVRPEVNVSIIGSSEYCARENLHLVAAEEGADLNYAWTGPNNLMLADSTLEIANINNNQQGYYELVGSNGACYDTVGIEVVVFPTPTLSLDPQVKTDFCTPLILLPQITGDNNVSFDWSPQEGLTCSDCPNPQVQLMVQSSYQLRVENDYLCSDSSSINIILDKDRMVYAPNILKRSSRVGNNRFTTFPGCVVEYIQSLDIYDRWGGRVFSSIAGGSAQAIEYWDGRIQGQVGQTGVYIWFAKVQLVDGSIEYLSGDVTLIE